MIIRTKVCLGKARQILYRFMKTCIKNLFLLPALMAGLGFMLTSRAPAQTFTNLHSFTATSGSLSTNSGGATPAGSLILSGNTLYGTAYGGGSSGKGTVFAVNTDRTGFTNLYSFTGGSDGANPFAGLILSGGKLYGTAENGGGLGHGTVFAVNTNGTGFTNLYSFKGASGPPLQPPTNSDGDLPIAGVILSGNTLYGTANQGGVFGNGTVFRVNTDGTGFTNLHSFTALSSVFSGTNSDGAQPYAGLVLSGSTLYGTTQLGGGSSNGTVFAVNIAGTGFTNLHSFTARAGPSGTNSDGAGSLADLIVSGNTLYGTAEFGGSSGRGTVFKLNTDGTGFTNLHSFTANLSDSYYPEAGLTFSGNTLYGTAAYGGTSGSGTVFKVNTDGTGFTNLYSFTALNNSTNSDGRYPDVDLILSGNALYGTAAGGGSSGQGTVFGLLLPPPPPLTIIRAGASVVLTWPTNFTGFTLQSATNLVSPTVWSNVSPSAVVVNTNNAVTNAIFSTGKFYRLSQ
jgi:uncharacterized repeat protein (TIGR03803 family)